VGSGNAPTLICADADLEHAAQSIVMSKSFDYGLICGSEHNLIAVSSVYAAFVVALERAGAAVLDEHETSRFRAQMIDPRSQGLKSSIAGRPASEIAQSIEVERPYPVQLLVVPAATPDRTDALSREKMSPILSLFAAADETDGLRMSRELLSIDGTGHTAIVHTQSREFAERFGTELPASRILVNSPGAQGVVGLTTGLVPSLTLGCGTFGSTSTTDNVTYTHMMNVKRVAYYAPERMAALAASLSS
jgi:acyl-CoA reductase-like NAD-dependent aldehyde dehydrogenase